MLRTQASTRLAIASAALLFLSTACVLDDVAIEEADVYACQTDDDCVGDFICLNGTCSLAVFMCMDGDGDNFDAGADCQGDPSTLDCDDSDNTVFPGGTEVCDGKDNDCNGEIDDGLGAVPCNLQEGVCAGAMSMCVDGAPGECDYGADYVADEGVDQSNDGLDNDCDGVADENRPDCVDGEMCGNTCLGGAVPDASCACNFGTRTCAMDGSSQCLDGGGLPVIFPFTQAEICNNGIDDDCDGTIDEPDCTQ